MKDVVERIDSLRYSGESKLLFGLRINISNNQLSYGPTPTPYPHGNGKKIKKPESLPKQPASHRQKGGNQMKKIVEYIRKKVRLETIILFTVSYVLGALSLIALVYFFVAS